MKELNIRPIGHVKNDKNREILKFSKDDIEIDEEIIGKQSNNGDISQIIINDEYIECLDGIEDFSHLVIVYWTHKTPNQGRNIKKVHPAGIKQMPIKGIFATRSPVRPNPIGIISVKFIDKKENILFVEGLDAINNTPVIDVKPHLPSYDSPLNVKLADWMYSIMEKFKKMSPQSHSKDIRYHPCICDEQKNAN